MELFSIKIRCTFQLVSTVQGKALYKESDIMKILDDAYKHCREEQRWV